MKAQMKAHPKDRGRLAGKHECPTCRSKLDGFTGVDNDGYAVPSNGDASICVYCNTGLIVRKQRWTAMTTDELLDAMKDGRFKLAYDMVQAFRKERET